MPKRMKNTILTNI